MRRRTNMRVKRTVTRMRRGTTAAAAGRRRRRRYLLNNNNNNIVITSIFVPLHRWFRAPAAVCDAGALLRGTNGGDGGDVIYYCTV